MLLRLKEVIKRLFWMTDANKLATSTLNLLKSGKESECVIIPRSNVVIDVSFCKTSDKAFAPSLSILSSSSQWAKGSPYSNAVPQHCYSEGRCTKVFYLYLSQILWFFKCWLLIVNETNAELKLNISSGFSCRSTFSCEL